MPIPPMEPPQIARLTRTNELDVDDRMSLRVANILFDLHEEPRVVHENGAARELSFAYGSPLAAGISVHTVDGQPVSEDALPGAMARRGDCVGPTILRYATPFGDFDLLVSCEAVHVGGRALTALTIVDVTPAQRAYTELQRAVTARDEFVSIAAHELRSPINALVLAVERMRLRVDALPPDLHKALDVTKRQVDRLTHLVQNVLDTSRMRAQRFELALERCDLCRVVCDAVERVSEQAGDAARDLRVTACDSIEAFWDAVRIEQVVHNLLVNALKYGGKSDVHVALRRDGDRAHLSVRDHGPGVDVADRARIFEPFERAATSFNSQSLGLGLYIVREIVASHGGSIQVEDPPGGGAAFVIRLPIREAVR